MFSGPQTIKNLLFFVVLSFVAGCQNLPNGEDWSNVPEPRQPRVDQVQYSHAVTFSPAGAALSGRQGERLRAFLTNIGAGRGDGFYLVSGNADNPVALSDARKAVVADYLSSIGVEVEPLAGDFAIAIPRRDSVDLIVRRYVVTLPGCPDWSGERFTYNNVPSSNWGCANATNLGLMVAEPGDLVRGRDGGPADGEYAATSISNYRKGETKPLDPEDVGVIESQQKSGGGE